MRTLKVSHIKPQPKDKSQRNFRYRQQEERWEAESEASIQFSRSHSPGAKKENNCCGDECAQLKMTVSKLKAENSALASENQLLKKEIQKFQKQNLEVMSFKSTADKRLQAKNMQCEELQSKIKELLSKVQSLQKQNLNASMNSTKHLQDKEETLTTICLQKQRSSMEDEVSRGFGERLQQQLGKYVGVKMKLELVLRKLQQKELLINFLQSEECHNND